MGVFRRLRHEIGARGWVLMAAIAIDVLVLSVFGAMKLQSDPLIVAIAIIAIAAVFAYERVFLSRWTAGEEHNGH